MDDICLGLLMPSGLSMSIFSVYEVLPFQYNWLNRIAHWDKHYFTVSCHYSVNKSSNFGVYINANGMRSKSEVRIDVMQWSAQIHFPSYIIYRNQRLKRALRKAAKTFFLHLFAILHGSLRKNQHTDTTALNTTPSNFYCLASINTRHASRFKTLGLPRKYVK